MVDAPPRGDTGVLAMDRHHAVNHAPRGLYSLLRTPPDTEMIPASGRGHADNALERRAEGAQSSYPNSHSGGVGLLVPLRREPSHLWNQLSPYAASTYGATATASTSIPRIEPAMSSGPLFLKRDQSALASFPTSS